MAIVFGKKKYDYDSDSGSDEDEKKEKDIVDSTTKLFIYNVNKID